MRIKASTRCSISTSGVGHLAHILASGRVQISELDCCYCQMCERSNWDYQLFLDRHFGAMLA